MIRTFLKKKEKEFWKKTRSSINPSILQFDYLHMKSLAAGIKKSIIHIPKGKKYEILDVGRGEKPYLPLLSPVAKQYIGVDVDNKVADVVAPAEKLPFKNNSFDLVVCFQTLEHCQYPFKVVDEIKRVLKSNGYAILTTHGIWIFHPGPHDYYRWTHEGLREVFKDFSKVEIEATLNSWTTILQLINLELYSLACRKWILKIPAYVVIFVCNVLGNILMPLGTKNLTIDYIVLAKK